MSIAACCSCELPAAASLRRSVGRSGACGSSLLRVPLLSCLSRCCLPLSPPPSPHRRPTAALTSARCQSSFRSADAACRLPHSASLSLPPSRGRSRVYRVATATTALYPPSSVSRRCPVGCVPLVLFLRFFSPSSQFVFVVVCAPRSLFCFLGYSLVLFAVRCSLLRPLSVRRVAVPGRAAVGDRSAAVRCALYVIVETPSMSFASRLSLDRSSAPAVPSLHTLPCRRSLRRPAGSAGVCHRHPSAPAGASLLSRRPPVTRAQLTPLCSLLSALPHRAVLLYSDHAASDTAASR